MDLEFHTSADGRKVGRYLLLPARLQTKRHGRHERALYLEQGSSFPPGQTESQSR